MTNTTERTKPSILSRILCALGLHAEVDERDVYLQVRVTHHDGTVVQKYIMRCDDCGRTWSESA